MKNQAENEKDAILSQEIKKQFQAVANNGFDLDDTSRAFHALRLDGEFNVPKFRISEITIGKLLGQGGFCDINEVESIKLDESVGIDCDSFAFDINGQPVQGLISTNSEGETLKGSIKPTIELQHVENSKPLISASLSRRGSKSISISKVKEGVRLIGEVSSGLHDDYEEDTVIIQSRQFIAKNCVRRGHARYVIKRLSERTKKDRDFLIQGVADLVRETMILASLQHPHILRMRGIASGKLFRSTHFLIVDRLFDTLTKRIKKWKEDEIKLFVTKTRRNNMMMERIEFAYDLASALQYLHERRIIHRDIKPDNIGFDVTKRIKLFDFGLAKTIPNTNVDEVFKLSGQVGSMRYMAPEVRISRPYNAKVDIFSFGVLLWQMVSLQTPFLDFETIDQFTKMIVDRGHRPPIDNSWPTDLKYVMQNSWKNKIEERLNATQVLDALHPIFNNDVGYLRSSRFRH